MKSEEIRQILSTFYVPDNKNYPGKNWIGNPLEAVHKVVEKNDFNWTESEIKIFSTALIHPSSTLTIDMIGNLYEAEKIILDAIHTIKPAFWSTLILHNVTFYLGIALIFFAVFTSYQGLDTFSIIMAGVGFGDIVFLFFKQPIRGLQRSIGNLIKLEVIYNSYTKNLRFWSIFDRSSDINIKQEIISEIEKNTEQTFHLIEKYCKR